jgi:hypothetical protein
MYRYRYTGTVPYVFKDEVNHFEEKVFKNIRSYVKYRMQILMRSDFSGSESDFAIKFRIRIQTPGLADSLIFFFCHLFPRVFFSSAR